MPPEKNPGAFLPHAFLDQASTPASTSRPGAPVLVAHASLVVLAHCSPPRSPRAHARSILLAFIYYYSYPAFHLAWRLLDFHPLPEIWRVSSCRTSLHFDSLSSGTRLVHKGKLTSLLTSPPHLHHSHFPTSSRQSGSTLSFATKLHTSQHHVLLMDRSAGRLQWHQRGDRW